MPGLDEEDEDTVKLAGCNELMDDDGRPWHI